MLEGYEEHDVVDRLMGELEAWTSPTSAWGAKAKVMTENIEHHIEEEEGEMFKTARQVFEDDELEELGDRMASARRRPRRSSSGRCASAHRLVGAGVATVSR